MELDQSCEGNLTKIKEKLNQNKVKLWLSPFYSENEGSNEDEIKNLANEYSSQLLISFDECFECLQTLQAKALQNIREKNNYLNTGVAALKVRIPNKQGSARIVTVSVELSRTGKTLKEKISKDVSVTEERLKVIFKGKIIKDDETLASQGIKHGVHMMAIILEDGSDLIKLESHMELLNSTKADIKLLTESEADDDYLQIADQSGKLLNLPNKERKSLILAMALHEKGRVAMKAEDFSLALIMLLEAEKEFSYCNSTLLKNVDNYGILNLDIVWCYLNLECVTQLPDAEERLHQCEFSFHQSYGPNLERLIVLKGSAGNELALFLRLHLLQSIVLYHQNKFEDAKKLLKKAEQELSHLAIDDVQLSQLIELGYATAEARLALRQSRGDLNDAVNIIENKRQEKKTNEEAEEREKKKRGKLGKCINGEWIDPQFHKALMAMGYSHKVARWALAQSCNNICKGINIIQEHPEYIPKSCSSVTDASVEQISKIGFDPKMAKLALKKYRGDVNKAVEELIVNEGNVIGFNDSSSESSDSDDSGPSTSKRKQEEVYSRVSKGMSRYEEDHLDLNLIAEASFIQKYKDLLSKKK